VVQHNHVDRGFKILNKRSRPLPTGPNSRPREPNKGKKKHCQPCHVGRCQALPQQCPSSMPFSNFLFFVHVNP